MAEAIGALASGITLAALFKTCIEAFELIQVARKQEQDFGKLKLRLNIEKCRLYTWGEAMGLTNSDDDQSRPILAFQFAGLVKESLEFILDLFNDADKIKNRYGCKETAPGPCLEDGQSHIMQHLAVSFANFRISNQREERASTSLLKKTRWMIYDRKKFLSFISETKDLIDGLKSITESISSEARQDHVMKRRITKITNIETLALISEVCEDDHPVLSDAASVRAETLSMPTSKRVEIEDWKGDVGDAVDLTTIQDIESLNMTELKHKYLKAEQELRILQAHLEREHQMTDIVAEAGFRSKKREWSGTPAASPTPSKRIAILREISQFNKATGHLLLSNIVDARDPGANRPGLLSEFPQPQPTFPEPSNFYHLMADNPKMPPAGNPVGHSRVSSKGPPLPRLLHRLPSEQVSTDTSPYHLLPLVASTQTTGGPHPLSPYWPGPAYTLLNSGMPSQNPRRRLISKSDGEKVYFSTEFPVERFVSGPLLHETVKGSGVLGRAFVQLSVRIHQPELLADFWVNAFPTGLFSSYPFPEPPNYSIFQQTLRLDSILPWGLAQELLVPSSQIQSHHTNFFYRLAPRFPELPDPQNLLKFMTATGNCVHLQVEAGPGQKCFRDILLMPGHFAPWKPELEKVIGADSDTLFMVVITRSDFIFGIPKSNIHPWSAVWGR